MPSSLRVSFSCASLLFIGQMLFVEPLAVYAASAAVKLGSAVVFTLPSGSSAVIQHNLDNALLSAKNRAPSAVTVVNAKTGQVVTLGGYKVVTVDAAMAKAAKTTPAALSKKWADALRAQLAKKSAVNDYVAHLNAASQPMADEPPVAPSQATVANSVPINNSPMTAPPAGNMAPNYQGGGYQQPGGYQQGNVQMNTTGMPPQMGAPMMQGQAGAMNMQAGMMPPNQGQPPLQGRVMFVPAGMTIPASLSTAISSQVAQAGDMIQATVSQNIDLANGQIPAGTVLIGQVTDSEGGRMLTRSGELSVKFTTMRLPDGTQAPISAHIVGGIGKYALAGGEGSDTVRGETAKNKIESAAIRTAVGAGAGAALGTAVGAIAAGGHGAGRGAWSGTAIGAGVGLADSLFLRKGADVKVRAGTELQLVLDQPVNIQCAQ